MLYKNLHVLREISVGFFLLGLTWLIAVGPGCSIASDLQNAVSALVLGGIFTILTTIAIHFQDPIEFKLTLTSLLMQLSVGLILSGVGYILYNSEIWCGINQNYIGWYLVVAGVITLVITQLITLKK